MRLPDPPLSTAGPAGYAPPRIPSPAAVDAFRAALERYLHDRSDSDAIRHSLRLICAEARAGSLRAEQLLVALKELWYGLPEVRRLPRGTRRARVLDELVSLCIEEFYADR